MEPAAGKPRRLTWVESVQEGVELWGEGEEDSCTGLKSCPCPVPEESALDTFNDHDREVGWSKTTAEGREFLVSAKTVLP